MEIVSEEWRAIPSFAGYEALLQSTVLSTPLTLPSLDGWLLADLENGNVPELIGGENAVNIRAFLDGIVGGLLVIAMLAGVMLGLQRMAIDDLISRVEKLEQSQ